jgi:hypothetical protein
MKHKKIRLTGVLLFVALTACSTSHAEDVTNTFIKCATTKDDKARLACYDKIRDDIVSANRPNQPSAKDTYQPIALTDLKVDIKTLKGKKITTSGYVQVMGEMAMLKSDPMDMAPIFIETDGLPRDDRKKLANGCQVVVCGVTFFGVVKALPLGVGIVASKVVWH